MGIGAADARATAEAVLLTGFSAADEGAAAEALALLGRQARAGDPVNDPVSDFVIAAAYDEGALRGFRAASLGESRPWAFCVPASDRALVAAAAAAREGFLLLSPIEGRELRRLLSALAEEARERSAGEAAYLGLERLEAGFSWRSDGIDPGRVARSLARLLSQAGFCRGVPGEDECALALEEAILNSLEHGNLGLDSSLRPEGLLAEDRYEAERARRLADPSFGARRIGIGVSMDAREARLSIEDEGEGFDASSIGGSPSGLQAYGKGIWLIRRPFDSVSYNGKGNKLTLAKRKPGA